MQKRPTTTMILSANSHIIYDCTHVYDRKGRCVRHPQIQLRKRKSLFQWKVILSDCPSCLVANGIAVAYRGSESKINESNIAQAEDDDTTTPSCATVSISNCAGITNFTDCNASTSTCCPTNPDYYLCEHDVEMTPSTAHDPLVQTQTLSNSKDAMIGLPTRVSSMPYNYRPTNTFGYYSGQIDILSKAHDGVGELYLSSGGTLQGEWRVVKLSINEGGGGGGIRNDYISSTKSCNHDTMASPTKVERLESWRSCRSNDRDKIRSSKNENVQNRRQSDEKSDQSRHHLSSNEGNCDEISKQNQRSRLDKFQSTDLKDEMSSAATIETQSTAMYFAKEIKETDHEDKFSSAATHETHSIALYAAKEIKDRNGNAILSRNNHMSFRENSLVTTYRRAGSSGSTPASSSYSVASRAYYPNSGSKSCCSLYLSSAKYAAKEIKDKNGNTMFSDNNVKSFLDAVKEIKDRNGDAILSNKNLKSFHDNSLVTTTYQRAGSSGGAPSRSISGVSSRANDPNSSSKRCCGPSLPMTTYAAKEIKDSNGNTILSKKNHKSIRENSLVTTHRRASVSGVSSHANYHTIGKDPPGFSANSLRGKASSGRRRLTQ